MLTERLTGSLATPRDKEVNPSKSWLVLNVVCSNNEDDELKKAMQASLQDHSHKNKQDGTVR